MHKRTFIITLALTAVLALPAFTWAEPEADASRFPWEGEITGNDVYVRSGPGVNYYACAKLNSGDRMLVLGEKFGWYQVTPPAKCFSYVDMSAVERQPGAAVGKIAQDQVYVRAGSDLEKRKTSTQMVLNKGAAVEILGEADGFYKIVPPKGATLYISKQYVKIVPANARTGMMERHAASERKPAAPGTPTTPGAPVGTPIPAGTKPQPAALTGTIPPKTGPAGATPGGDTTATPPGVQEPPADDSGVVSDFDDEETEPIGADSMLPGSTIGGTPRTGGTSPGEMRKRPAPQKPGDVTAATTGRYAALLTILESELRAAMQMEADEHTLKSLRDRFAEIAGQKDEDVPARVAQIRISQLDRLVELRAGKVTIAAESEALTEFRSRMNEERMKIMRQRVEKVWEKFDLEGELRQSYAFAPEKRRFRLVDPNTQMTIAYVDIPPAANAKPDELIGRLVGIRTSGQKYNPATQVPIATALEIADLSARTTPAAPSVPKPEMASPGGNKLAETAKPTKEQPTAAEGEKTPSAKPMAITGQEQPPEKPRK